MGIQRKGAPKQAKAGVDVDVWAAEMTQRPAKSVCHCGHLGDGWVGGQHAGVLGHGECEVANCGCTRFTWKKFLPGHGPLSRAARKVQGGFIDTSSTRRQPHDGLVFFALISALIMAILVATLRMEGEIALSQAHAHLFMCDDDTNCMLANGSDE